jgi:competence protein ComEC
MPRAGWIAVGALLAALLGGTAGTLLGGAEPAAPSSGPGAVLLMLAAACLGAIAGIARASPSVVAMAGGAALVSLRLLLGSLSPAPAPADRLPASLPATQVDVVSVSTPSDGAQRAVVVVDAPAGSGLRLYARLPRYPEIAPGDRVSVSGSVRPPPEGPGFGDYLRRSGIAGTLTARDLERVPAPPGPAAWLEHRRRDAGEILAQVLPAPQAGLAAGVLIGLRDQVDRDVAAAFTAAGLTHIVAISGWNIAVVAGVLAALLRRLSRRRRSIATLAAIAAYALAAGAGASVIRAALMAAAVLGSREVGRPGTAASALGLAALALMVIDPAVIEDAGFQLSVAATAGLLAWGTRLSECLQTRTAGPGRRVRAPGWLVDSLGVSLAAQAATLPLVLLDFGRVSLVSPAANLVAAPLVIPVMAASAVSLVAGWFVSLGAPPVLGAVAGTAGAVVLGLLVAVGRVAASVPGASVTLAPPVNQLLAVATAAGVAAIAVPAVRRPAMALRAGLLPAPGPARSPHGQADVRPGSTAARAQQRRIAPADKPGAGSRHRIGPAAPGSGLLRALALSAAGALVALTLVAAARPDGRLHVSILDVGQGDAILLAGSSGGRILVDTGPDPERLLPQLDARVPPWDRRLDLLVLTHPHEDHVGGAAVLLRRYRVARVAEPGMRGSGPGWGALTAELARQGRTTERLAAGGRLGLDGATVRVLWPRAGTVPEAPGETGTAVNDVSIVLDVRYGARRFLLMGDAEQEVDAALVAGGSVDPGDRPVDVLKVAHHGSRTATTGDFLAAARPRVAVVSVGAQNDYGHPAPATLERLRSAGATVLRTDEAGTVTVSTDGVDLRIESAVAAWAARARAGRLDEAGTRQGAGQCPPAGPGPGAGWSGPCAEAAIGRAAGWPNGQPPGCIESPRGPLARGSRRHPARSRSARLAAGTRRRGRGDRLVPGGALRGAGHCRRPGTGGGCGPPARHRQAAPGGRSGPGTGPWCRGRTMAEPAGLPGAGARRGGASDNAPAGRRPVRPLERRRNARGADHRLRGQARRAAPRGDERPLRGLGRPLPRVSREPGPGSGQGRATGTRGMRDGRGQPACGTPAQVGGSHFGGGAPAPQCGARDGGHEGLIDTHGAPRQRP